MVVTARSSARKAGNRQLCTGSPSTSTVQAPQSPASQPFFTPKQPSRAGTCAGIGRDAAWRRDSSVHEKGHGAPPCRRVRGESLRRIATSRVGARPACRARRRNNGARNFGFELLAQRSARRQAGKRNRIGRGVDAVTVSVNAPSSGERVRSAARRAAEWAQRDLAERGSSAQRRKRQVDGAQQFARLKHVGCGPRRNRRRRRAARRRPASRSCRRHRARRSAKSSAPPAAPCRYCRRRSPCSRS